MNMNEYCDTLRFYNKNIQFTWGFLQPSISPAFFMRKSSQEHPFCSNIIVFLIDQHIRMIRMFLKPVCLCSMKLYLATLAIFIQIHSSVRSRPSLVSVHPKIKKYLQSGNRSAVDASKPHAMEYRFRNKSM